MQKSDQPELIIGFVENYNKLQTLFHFMLFWGISSYVLIKGGYVGFQRLVRGTVGGGERPVTRVVGSD